MRKIRWGVLSTGIIAHCFAKALQATADAELYAVSSRSAGKAAAFAAQYGFERSYGSAEEMLADENVEAVYIASPMSCHYEDSLKCLRAGKSVLCEKTITLNCAQLDEILKLAKEKNLFFMEAMWMKTLPHYRQAKKWVDEGKIGSIRMIRSDFMNRCEGSPESRLFRPDLGGGALLDLGVYNLTFSMDLLGYQPEQITASAVMKNGVDYDDAVWLRYGDALAVMTFGFDSQAENSAGIIGDKGMIVFPDWFFCSDRVCLYDENNKLVQDVKIPHVRNGYEYEIAEVDRCIKEGLTESPLVPHKETRDVMVVIDMIKEQIDLHFPGEEI